jgi:hypothetical protein
MNVPQYASSAAKLLRRYLPAAPTAVQGDREQGIATVERAMWARARRRRLQWLGALVASAAFISLAVGLSSSQRTSADPNRRVSIEGVPAGRGAALRIGERAQPLAAGANVAAGQRIETAQAGGASLKLSTGTAIELSDSTSFRVDSQGLTEHFTLERGQLSAHVAKLNLRQRFIVTTPDAEIEVRGTRFRLQVLEGAGTCGSGTRTRLEVSEGVVEVRATGSSVSVTAGQRWPSDCTQPSLELTPSVTSGSASAPTLPEPRRVRGAPLSHRDQPAANESPEVGGPAPRVSEDDSSLTEANDAFAAAVALRRKGDSEGALRAYQALIARFPASPLAENALVERMRILNGKGDARARHEAERYLSRYPKGFAASEARLLTVTP